MRTSITVLTVPTLQSRARGGVYSNRSTVVESAVNSEPEYY